MLVSSTFLHLHSVETPYANPPFLFSPILLPIECQFGPIRSKWGEECSLYNSPFGSSLRFEFRKVLVCGGDAKCSHFGCGR